MEHKHLIQIADRLFRALELLAEHGSAAVQDTPVQHSPRLLLNVDV